MDLKNIKTFIQVAEMGSFTKAGDYLGYSQPTVSFQIKQLENELGVQLFERIGHTVTLTENGKIALNHAQQINKQSCEMFNSIKNDILTGTVRIAMADSLCMPLFLSGFEVFRKKYPGINIKIMTAGTDELFRLLDHNEADIVCTLDRHIFSSKYKIAHEEKIGAHFICAEENYAACRVSSLRQLLSYPFILTEKGMSYRQLLDDCLADFNAEITPILEVSSADLICRLVEKNNGISFLPDYVTRNAQVHIINIKDMQIDLWKQIIHHKNKWVSPQVRAVIEHLSSITLA